MREVVDVNTGEVEIRKGEFILRSTAIGSCLVITAYDARNKIGALAHIMLPDKAPQPSSNKTKYAVDAIEEMERGLISNGTKKEDIEVCIVGAGNVLKKADDNICHANIESVIRILRQKRIVIKAAVLGGVERKAVTLDIERGAVFYTEGDSVEKLLWSSIG